VASPEVIRAQLCFAAYRHQYAHQLDVENAFIVNDLDVEIYMPVPIGLREFYKEQGLVFPTGEVVVQLKKTLYGLRQSGYLFQQRLGAALESVGFQESTEPCLFSK